MMAKSCSSKAKRVLKCFCGCSELTEDEVNHIYRLGAQGTLIEHQAKRMLRAFLQQQRQGDKSEAEQLLDVYEMCADYLLKQQGILTLDEFDELVDCGLPYDLEKELKAKILTGDASIIAHCLLRIQGECRNGIEASTEYKAYKQAILKKLRN